MVRRTCLGKLQENVGRHVPFVDLHTEHRSKYIDLPIQYLYVYLKFT